MTQTFGQIWATLSALDVSAKVIEKPGTGNPSYLSWGDAWGLLMGNFPNATYHFHRSDKRYGGDEVFEALDGSAEVRCTVTIEGCERDMWLPIMDHKFNAIVDPDAREVSDAKMRCMVKCLAMFGLGHSLYAKAKEDVPDDSRAPRAPRAGRNSPRSTPGKPIDNRPTRESRQRLDEKVEDNTAVNLLKDASTLDQLNERYDEVVADAKKRGNQPLIDKLFAAYDVRAAELERA